MSIYHDAYLFKPNEFAADVLPYVRALLNGIEGQQILHKHVIELFEQNSKVQALAMEYGAWDTRSLHADAAREGPDEPQDLGKWIVFMLYDYLFPVPSELGLGAKWSLLENIRGAFGWHDSDKVLPVHGHSFGYFAQTLIADSLGNEVYQRGDLQYWEHVWPGSTASQIGWLNHADVQRVLSKLTMDQPQLSGMNLRRPGMIVGWADNEAIKQTYQTALQMLRSASAAQCGLCLITSGSAR